MKKTAPGRLLVILVSALFVLSLPHLAQAHNPQKVDVSYDFASQTLIVKITHASNNPDKHFVKEVTVKKNGQVVQRGTYTRQAGDTFTYTYSYTYADFHTFSSCPETDSRPPSHRRNLGPGF